MHRSRVPSRPALLGLALALAAPTGAGAQGSEPDPLLRSRLLHYRVVCVEAGQCKLECYQDGRIVISRARLEVDDRVTLVLTDGFSDRLQPLWIEIEPPSGRDVRTILLPRDVLCDLQGLTIKPLEGTD